MFKKVLSFDCANKSLAYCCATVDIEMLRILFKSINTKPIAPLKPIYQFSPELIYELSRRVKNIVQLHKCAVIDVIPDIKLDDTDKVLRTKCLRNVLNSIEFDLSIEDTILVENQPRNKNDKSTIVEHQLLMYYADYDIDVIDPKKKNMFSFDPSLKHDFFVSMYDTQYRANKEHTKANFLKFAEVFDWQQQIQAIPKDRLADAADAFMQMYVWVIEKFVIGVN